jgi:hypothetical protein
VHEPGVEISRTGMPSRSTKVRSVKTALAWSYRVTKPVFGAVTSSMSARNRSSIPSRILLLRCAAWISDALSPPASEHAPPDADTDMVVKLPTAFPIFATTGT